MKAVERNMNGAEAADLLALMTFLRSRLGAGATLLADLRNPFDLLRQSLDEQAMAERPISRYKLLIDTTVDDSILRVLRARNDLDASMADAQHSTIVLKLSDFPEDTSLQQVMLVSSVKYAAETGNTAVVLSQTEEVNESFYDLFNQHFQAIEDRDADGRRTTSYHANIALGSH